MTSFINPMTFIKQKNRQIIIWNLPKKYVEYVTF